MLNARISILYLMAVIALGGCATTSVSSFKDPAFAGQRFSKIAVFANTDNLEWRGALEEEMAERINEQGGLAVPSMLIVPPTGSHTEAQAVERLLSSGVVAVLTVDIGSTGVQEDWVPQTGSQTSVYGNTAYTTNYGGYSVSKPWAQMQTRLVDLNSGRNVWMATSTTGGNGFSDWDTVRSSYCKKIASELAEAGIY